MKSIQAPVFDVKKYAVHDGPGIRTTIFLKGCPLHCKWCQNPEAINPAQELMLTRMKCIGCGACARVCGNLDKNLMLKKKDCTLCGRCVDVCTAGARHFAAQYMTPEEAVKIAAGDKIFYDASREGGVTFSGGECLIYPDFMEEALRLCRQAGIHTTVDTSGAVPWSTFERILPYTCLFLYDIKQMDPLLHKAYTGQDNTRILDNIKKLADRNANIIIRIPLIPGMTDTVRNISEIGDFIRDTLKNKIIRVELLPYNKLAESKYGNHTAYTDGGVGEYSLPELMPQSAEYVSELHDLLAKKNVPVFSEIL